jgi:hypothetical protein
LAIAPKVQWPIFFIVVLNTTASGADHEKVSKGGDVHRVQCSGTTQIGVA